MKHPLFLFCCLFAIYTTFGQSIDPIHSRAKVMVPKPGDLQKIAALGVDISHGYHEKNCCFTTDFSAREIKRMREEGWEVIIEIENVAEHYIQQNLFPSPTNASSRKVDCEKNKPNNIKNPQNFQLGSMGGYFRYDEILDQLDLMQIKYPHLISPREPIGNFKTYNGTSIFYVRISNSPLVDQNEKPKLLHTALHHAREPISASQMIYFMWYLLENYATDPYIQSLVNATEVYFIPILNPDGYRRNQETHPNGGGMHRKNRRFFGSGNYGVDLNRNYSFEFAYDNIGSSSNDWDETYRGPSPASEPETRAVQLLCNEKGFDIALNHHSFGNVLLFPFGYADVAVPDEQTFFSLASALTKENNYQYGRPWEVPAIGYSTNGSSDDWMYGDFESKPPIFSFTPETGSLSQGFWPHRDDIIPLCRSALNMNITSMALVNNYAEMQEMTPNMVGSTDNKLLVKIKRKGLRDGQYQINVKALTQNITMITSSSMHSLLPNAALETAFEYQINPNIQIGDPIRFALELNMGDGMISRDTVEKIYMGEKSERFRDMAMDASQWVVEGLAQWGVDESDYFSAPTCLSDSPGSKYERGSTSTMKLFQPVNLANARAAYLSFRARWEIEPGADYVTISASQDGFVFRPLCGKFTKPGNRQQQDEPSIYDGFQDEWVLEVMDLQDYIGKNLYLQVTLNADASNQFDGFFIDDITVVVFESGSSTVPASTYNLVSTKAFPNPAKEKVFIQVNQPLTSLNSNEWQVEIFDMLGKSYFNKAATISDENLLEIPVSTLTNGMYLYRVSYKNQFVGNGRLSISR
jgi:carboxypeptidase T